MAERSRILIGALSGWQHEDRRKACLRTWVADAEAAGIDVVFLLGCPGLKKPQREGHLLRLPCPNDYPALPQRTRWFCRWALERADWDYLLKCDDDTYVCVRRLAAYDLADRDYVGAEWWPGVRYGSGGAGYFLSRRAARIVAERLTRPHGAEDALVGRVLRRARVRLSIEPRLVPFGNTERRPRPDNDLITGHALGRELFELCHRELGNTAAGA